MKRVSRAQLRGKPLHPLCKHAHTTTNEYGPEDKRIFCYGIRDLQIDDYLYMCYMCGAFVVNEKPPEVYHEPTGQ